MPELSVLASQDKETPNSLIESTLKLVGIEGASVSPAVVEEITVLE